MPNLLTSFGSIVGQTAFGARPAAVLTRRSCFAKREAERFEPLTAPLEAQDLVVGQFGAVVADDPKLELDVHGRRHAEVIRKLQGIRPTCYPPPHTHAIQPPAISVARHIIARVSR
jgi:hypothetical protein